MARQSAQQPERIDDLEKREAVEVCVPRADLADAVFAHQNSGVRVMNEVAGQLRHLVNEVLCDIGVPRRRHQYAQTWRGKERQYELPCRWRRPRTPHDARMGRNPQEFVDNRPRHVPRVRSRATLFEPLATRRVMGRSGVRRIHENVGIDDEQLSVFHGPVQHVAVGDVDQ